MLRVNVLLLAGLLLTGAAFPQRTMAQPPSLDLATLRSDAHNGFSNAGWTGDRYPTLPKLDAKKSMLVADLQGPGVIRAIHTTKHPPENLSSRGVVIEIWFDDASEPAVMCPMADFFGDGCNGESTEFSTNFIENAPGSYNCYFPMPFKKRAKVIFRNDTDSNFGNYSFVEWDKLPQWKDDLGFFHATYQRKKFQLGPQSSETLIELSGRGQVIGRQFSIVSHEPFFERFLEIMEGNNELNIDGTKRAIDYLGSEDSFTFSWGFQKLFNGVRAGITLMQPAGPAKLSVYRFHDHKPIRFDKSLNWKIDWTTEGALKAPKFKQAADAGGCWVDYVTVHYWYQDTPGGYKHQPLEPVAERMKQIIAPPKK